MGIKSRGRRTFCFNRHRVIELLNMRKKKKRRNFLVAAVTFKASLLKDFKANFH